MAVKDPVEPEESPFHTARVYLMAQSAYHASRHDILIRQKNGYNRAKYHKLLSEVFYLGKRRIDLLQEADEVLKK